MKTRPWSFDDIHKLEVFASRGMSGREAAKRLKRSYGALRFKACQIGLSFHSQLKARHRSNGRRK